jgi:uncharacterized membrane protein
MEEFFSSDVIKTEAKEHLKTRLGSAILFLLLTGVINSTINRFSSCLFYNSLPISEWKTMLPTEIVRRSFSETFSINGLFHSFITGVVSAGTALASVSFYLHMTRSQEKVSFIDMLVFGFRHLPAAFLFYLLREVIIRFGIILFIIPGIIWSLEYIFVMYILADHPDMPVLQAFRRSSELTNGRKMDLFNFHLSFIPLFLLIPITLGLAIFYVAPLYSSSLAVYYNRLIYQEEGVVPDAPIGITEA